MRAREAAAGGRSIIPGGELISPARSGCRRTVAPSRPPGRGSSAGLGSTDTLTAAEATVPPPCPIALSSAPACSRAGSWPSSRPGPLGDAAAAACRELGATTPAFAPEDHEGPLDTLVIDAAGRFAAAPQEGLAPLRAAADDAWVAARAAGTAMMIDGAGGRQDRPARSAARRRTRTPRPTRAALENMARTLSIEWARYDIRVAAIHPGASTPPAEVAALVAYLASPAGDYFSGCRFDVGGV